MDELYQKAMMRHAGNAVRAGRLDAPDGTVTLDNPMCGDRITIDVRVDDAGRITDLAQHARACVLCQASASIIGAHALGADRNEIDRARAEVDAMLKQDGPTPAGEWADLDVFRPAIPHRSRHTCVTLPFDALHQALAAAQAAVPAPSDAD